MDKPAKITKKPKPATSKPVASRSIIGWREWVQLPGLLDQPVKAKIDTGARTSAIHAFNIVRVKVEGEDWVEFGVHPVQRMRHPVVRCRAPVLDQRIVISSSGHKQMRYVVRTTAQIGDIRWKIELSLADRDQMGFRMLLGREALRRRFVIDPAGSYRLSARQSPSVPHDQEATPHEGNPTKAPA